MGGMGGVLHDAVGFAGASCKENVQDGWERGQLCTTERKWHSWLNGVALTICPSMWGRTKEVVMDFRRSETRQCQIRNGYTSFTI